MEAWQFKAMQTLAKGEKVHGVILVELKEAGLIFLQQSTESWLPTPEANQAFKEMKFVQGEKIK